jgi:hypothetical protein
VHPDQPRPRPDLLGLWGQQKLRTARSDHL